MLPVIMALGLKVVLAGFACLFLVALSACSSPSVVSPVEKRGPAIRANKPAAVRAKKPPKPFTLRFGSDKLRTGNLVWDVDFHPNGKTLATAMAHRPVFIWDAVSGGRLDTVFHVAQKPGKGSVGTALNALRDLVSLPKVQDGATGVAYSPNGQYLAVFSDGVNVVDTRTGKVIAKTAAQRTGHDPLQFTADGETLAFKASSSDGMLWDYASGTSIRFRGHRYLRAVTVSPDRKWFASGGQSDPLRIWTLPKKAQPKVIEVGFTIYSLASSPDGSLLAVGGRAVRVLRLSDYKVLAECDVPGGWAVALEFSPDGDNIAYVDGGGHDGGYVTSCVVANGKTQQVGHHHDGVNGLAWSPDGKKIAVGTAGTAAMWWADGSGMAVSQPGHSKGITVMALDGNGKWLATGGRDGAIYLWEVASGKLTRTLRTPQDRDVRAIRFSPNGEWLVATIRDGELLRWQTSDFGATAGLQLKGRSPDGVEFSRDSKRLMVRVGEPFARGGEGSHLVAIDMTTWKAKTFKQSPKDGLLDIAYVGSTDRLLGQVGIETYAFVDSRSGRLTRLPFSAENDWLETITPDGKLVLTCRSQSVGEKGGGGDCMLRGINDWAAIQTYHGLKFSVHATAISNGGALVAAGDAAGYVIVWNRATGEVIKRMKHGDAVSSMVFTPDGKGLITAGSDTTALLWPLQKRSVAESP